MRTVALIFSIVGLGTSMYFMFTRSSGSALVVDVPSGGKSPQSPQLATLLKSKQSIERSIADAEAREAEFEQSQVNAREKLAELAPIDAEIKKIQKRITIANSYIDSYNTKLDNAQAEWNSATARANQLAANLGKRGQFASSYNRALEDVARAEKHIIEYKGAIAEKESLTKSAKAEIQTHEKERTKIRESARTMQDASKAARTGSELENLYKKLDDIDAQIKALEVKE